MEYFKAVFTTGLAIQMPFFFDSIYRTKSEIRGCVWFKGKQYTFMGDKSVKMKIVNKQRLFDIHPPPRLPRIKHKTFF